MFRNIGIIHEVREDKKGFEKEPERLHGLNFTNLKRSSESFICMGSLALCQQGQFWKHPSSEAAQLPPGLCSKNMDLTLSGYLPVSTLCKVLHHDQFEF